MQETDPHRRRVHSAAAPSRTAATVLVIVITILVTAAAAYPGHGVPPADAAPAPSPGDSLVRPDAVWPVTGEAPAAARPRVERAWEPPATPWGPGHRGVDVHGHAGQWVRAAVGGRVSFAGRVAGRGVLSVELLGAPPDGTPLRTTYQPVRPLVSEGERVTSGEVIGVLEAGGSHCRRGCLHWGLLRGERYLDPLSLLPPRLLSRRPARLLPTLGVPLPR